MKTPSICFRKWRDIAAISLALGLALGARTALAQTVRPVIDELGNPGKGRIEYVNDSDTPLNVVLQAKSFSVDELGQISYRPLEEGIHLKLSATSFRILPQQTYYVFYEANANAAPSWFVIYALFSGFPFRTREGMSVQLQLPHTVYLLPKQGLEKSDVHISQAKFVPESKQVELEVENTGDNFGRVLQTQIGYPHKKEEGPGFPMFPHSRRILQVPVDSQESPQELVLHFQNFKVEQQLEPRSP